MLKFLGLREKGKNLSRIIYLRQVHVTITCEIIEITNLQRPMSTVVLTVEAEAKKASKRKLQFGHPQSNRSNKAA